SRYVPPFISDIRRAPSTCASRLDPRKECHFRFRFPVDGPLKSMMIAQWPGEPYRICPFISASSFRQTCASVGLLSRCPPGTDLYPLLRDFPRIGVQPARQDLGLEPAHPLVRTASAAR